MQPDMRATKSRLRHSSGLTLLGAAWGVGAPDPRCAAGPSALRDRGLLEALRALDPDSVWGPLVQAPEQGTAIERVATATARLAAEVAAVMRAGRRFLVLGGDHTSAIGTWSGAARALPEGTELGLLWIDAHLDAHTHQTTATGALHGMPLACLLGAGDPRLTGLAGHIPALDPGRIAVIGVRSFEAEEPRLLERLGVRVYPQTEVTQRGVAAVVAEAAGYVTRGGAALGLSIDLDVLEPGEAPGVCTPVAGGIPAADLTSALRALTERHFLIGAEIAEYNPALDTGDRTAAAALALARASAGRPKTLQRAVS